MAYKDKKVALFNDASVTKCYAGDMVYHITLSKGGKYKVGWEFAEDIHRDMKTWHTLISIGLVRGLYKNKEKAEEYCYCLNA